MLRSKKIDVSEGIDAYFAIIGILQTWDLGLNDMCVTNFMMF